MAVAAVALFCDDVREERSGAITLVGVMPDNVEVPSVPGAFPRVAIYLRVHLDVDSEPKAMEVLLTFPDGNQHKIAEFSKEMVKMTQAEAASSGNKLAGFFGSAIASPFPVPSPGRAVVTLKRGDETQVIGGLNFVLNPPSSVDSAV
jgi:hypothetical protein